MSKQGGKREGAGRPAAPLELKRKTVSVRLPKWLIDEIDGRGDKRGEQIEDALIKFYKLRPPR